MCLINVEFFNMDTLTLFKKKCFLHLCKRYFIPQENLKCLIRVYWTELMSIYILKNKNTKIRSSKLIPVVKLTSVQSLSCVRLFATPWIVAHQASLSITNSRSSRKLMSIESVMPSSHLILCRPLLLLPSIPPSIQVFSNKSTLHMRWPKYWSFSFIISPSKEIPGLISFRMDWLDLLAVQGILKSLFQHHSSKASILWHSASQSNSYIHIKDLFY